MARFILDVANLDEEGAQRIMERVCDELADTVTTIALVDVTNDNQFYNQDDIEEGNTNILTQSQIDAFNKQANQ